MTQNAMPPAIVVMGVSGSGKSTVGEALAQRLGWEFRDADSFHPAANIAKMSAGHPLTDDDRWPWLDAIVAWIDAHRLSETHGVVTCSALKRAYRDRLRNGHDDICFAHLAGDIATIGARMAKRAHHFMPTALLQSQFDALEPPTSDERVISVSVKMAPGVIVSQIIGAISADARTP